MSDDTTPNGICASNGRFAVGNPGGPGNPHGGQVARLRSVMLEVVTPEDMKDVVLRLVEMAKGGDLKAIELLLNRTLGKADSGAESSSHDPGRTAAIVARLKAARAESSGVPLNLEENRERIRARIAKSFGHDAVELAESR